MRCINPHAAGIDVGSEKLFVAVVDGPVKVFETFTESHEKVRDYLLSEAVTTVAMEATGVYWLALYEVLEAAGLEVCVVNGAHVKSVSGRKSDAQDCQWLAELHSCGLLRNGFVPDETIRCLRDYQRLRQDHVTMASAHIQHMQKALERMNVKIHIVLSNLTGASGLRLVRAIVQGERDPEVLVELCDPQILRYKRERMRKALRGNWRQEHLFALRQALEGWEFYQRQIRDCDTHIEEVLRELAAQAGTPPDGTAPMGENAPSKRIHHNAPEIKDLHRLLVQINGGNDLSTLPGLTDYSVLQLAAEIGTDMTRWATEKHFTSWLTLAPKNKISGGRLLSSRTPPAANRAAAILRMAAMSLGRTETALGAFYRRLAFRVGKAKAITATARKLAILVYRTLRDGLVYRDPGAAAYDAQHRERVVRRLRQRAANLGFVLVDRGTGERLETAVS